MDFRAIVENGKNKCFELEHSCLWWFGWGPKPKVDLLDGQEGAQKNWKGIAHGQRQQRLRTLISPVLAGN